MLNKIVLVLLSIIFITGCGSSPTPPVTKKVKKMPSWVLSPTKDTPEYMYGVAVESDRETAIKAALSDMVSKLGVSLESSFESTQEVDNFYSSTLTKNKIKSEVAKIKINNYEVVKSQRISYREFAVMVRSDKKKFLSGLKEEIKNKKNNIESKLEAVESKDKLSKYNEKKRLAEEAKSLTSNVFIISQLDNNFNKNSYLKFINKIQNEFEKEANSLSFYIIGDSKSNNFVNVIKNYLAKGGFNISNKKRKNSIVVSIKTKDNVDVHSVIKIAVLRLNIEVYDNSQRVGGKTLILKERYNGSIISVYKNATIHLEQDIEQKGINEVLGINLDI
jgi:hypothetical protein